MSTFHRQGHFRRNKSGTTTWVNSHSVSRDTWDHSDSNSWDFYEQIQSPASDLEALMLSVVAEKTGYPINILNLEMDLEGDLGIDSLQLEEILASVYKRAPHLPKGKRVRLNSVRTLREIVTYLDSLNGVAKRNIPVPVRVRSNAGPAKNRWSCIIALIFCGLVLFTSSHIARLSLIAALLLALPKVITNHRLSQSRRVLAVFLLMTVAFIFAGQNRKTTEPNAIEPRVIGSKIMGHKAKIALEPRSSQIEKISNIVRAEGASPDLIVQNCESVMPFNDNERLTLGILCDDGFIQRINEALETGNPYLAGKFVIRAHQAGVSPTKLREIERTVDIARKKELE